METMRRTGIPGFSIALFAPAWAYENFSKLKPVPYLFGSWLSNAEAVDQSLWEGKSVPERLQCAGLQRYSSVYGRDLLTNYTQLSPAGSSNFFYSSFTRAFGSVRFRSGVRKTMSMLGSQSVLPFLIPTSLRYWEASGANYPLQILFADLEHPEQWDRKKCFLAVMRKIVGLTDSCTYFPGSTSLYLPLFRFNMPGDDPLKCLIRFARTALDSNVKLGFYLAYQPPDFGATEFQYVTAPFGSPGELLTLTVGVCFPCQGARLIGIGVYCKAESSPWMTERLLDVSEIMVRPSKPPTDPPAIVRIAIRQRGQEPRNQKRLTWELEGPLVPERGVPFSRITGPFSCFSVAVNGHRIVGRAYCLEFPMVAEEFSDFLSGKSSRLEIVVWGMTFLRQTVRSQRAVLYS